MSNETKKPPVEKFRDQGITVNVWEQITDKGTFYSRTTEYSYKDRDGKWKPTDFLPSRLIPTETKLLDQAYAYILKRKAEGPAGRAGEHADYLDDRFEDEIAF